MTSIDEIYAGKWLKSEQLQGKKHTVTIEAWRVAEFAQDDGSTKKQIALKFSGKSAELALNQTNANAIAAALGTRQLNDWIGQHIIIYPTTTSFGNKTVPCIRVEDPEALQMSDDIPF